MVGLVHPGVGIEPVVHHDPVDQVINDRRDVVDASESIVERRLLLNGHCVLPRVPLIVLVFALRWPWLPRGQIMAPGAAPPSPSLCAPVSTRPAWGCTR